MKYINLTALAALLLISCQENNTNKVEIKKTKSHTNAANNQIDLSKDTIQLINLTKDLYKWVETKSSVVDFAPLQKEKTDTFYSGIDLDRHKKRIKELEETNLFADEFIENYAKIGLTIDEKMKSKSLKWFVAELPPFGNDANPWCNCQDNPDNYWEILTINNVVITKNEAIYNWTWGKNFEYKVKAVKENGAWKISYLQGFDFKEFVK